MSAAVNYGDLNLVNQALGAYFVLEGERLRRSFHSFVCAAWPILEPGSQYKDNWHIGAICEHLEACKTGQIKRLIINIPPRQAKSTLVSVMWPAWIWTDEPWRRILSASYARELATRDAVSARRLMESPWYRQRWGYRFRFTTDQNVKQRYENDKRGVRLITSVESGTTGEGGDIRIIDDPIDAQAANSEKSRQDAILWWRETFSTRGNDPNTDVIVLIMQRMAKDDLTGFFLEQGGGWEHLCLPMRYESKHPHVHVTSIGFEDPRTKDGELLAPQRYSEQAVQTLENDLGPYGVAGQLQQRPEAREGSLFKVDRIIIVDSEDDLPAKPLKTVRYWDKAATEGGDGPFSAGVKMTRLANRQYCIMHAVHGRWSTGKRESMIRAQADVDGKKVKVYVEQEPGSGGKESAQATIRNLAGWIAEADLPGKRGSKDVRMEPLAAQIEAGNVYMLRGPWNQEYLDELRGQPAATIKDYADASSGAFAKVAAPAIDWEKLVTR